MWPVTAVIGENGGLCFRYDTAAGATQRCYWAEEKTTKHQFARLTALGAEIVSALPGAEISHDQRYRETTLAFRNDDPIASERIVAHLVAAGARTTQNSIWVLGWFGGFDKLAMTRRILAEWVATDIERDAESCLYVGDSPNDEPMFGFFGNSVGVAGVRDYLGRLATPPKWITQGGGGLGFVEVAEALLRAL